jgi:hypothetical protein
MTAVDMHFAETVKDEVTYHLPEGYTVESAPPDTTVPWTGHAVLVVKSTTDKGSVQVVRSLARAFALLDANDYPALHDFYQKVTAADQLQLVLRTPSASQGD